MADSIISLLRRGLQYEVFQDFQEVIFETFQRPSVVLIRNGKDSLRLCFPRKRNPVPREFYHYLFDIVDPSQLPGLLEDDETRIIREGLSAEDSQKPWQWGWRLSAIGLIDFYFPIRLRSEPHLDESTVAVLAIGKLRDPGSLLDNAEAWIHRITLGDQWPHFFPQMSVEERRQYEGTLRTLLHEIPVLGLASRRLIEKEVVILARLLELTLNRVLHTARLFSAEDFIHSLGLGQPGLHITKRELWNNVEGALSRIKNHLGLSTAVVYSSNYSDYTEMTRQLSVGADGKPWPEFLGLASYGEFEWLQSQDWTVLPTKGDHFSWLNTLDCFGGENAIIFGREMIGGHLVLLGFGMSRRLWLNQTQKAALYEAVTSRVFRFIENALFRIELDQLMAETGHLMGRAIGKVKGGADVLLEILPPREVKSPQRGLLQSAQWSMQDGLMRLDLIRQNFYSFGSERLSVEAEAQEGRATLGREPVDAPKLLESMRSLFDRAAYEARLKPIRYVLLCDSAITVGRKHDLQLVFLNVFDNALKFAYANTFITIRVVLENKVCIIEFINLGVGVAGDEADRMFRRLSRSRYKDPSRRIEGLGLGLSYCRRVMTDIFRGSITLASREAPTPSQRRFEGDNWLTTIRIELPLNEAGVR